jgi:1-acyl-sn-glycerol-3-phosphate acyltransferase
MAKSRPFRTGVEKILARRPVPVVPMALRGLWGSVWSRRDSMLHRARLPRRFRARVELVIDAAVAPEQVRPRHVGSACSHCAASWRNALLAETRIFS